MGIATHPQETERLAALRALRVLDGPLDREFVDLVNLAASICRAPIAFISLIDGERQWFKTSVGLELDSICREESLCSHAMNGDGLYEVTDLQEHPVARTLTLVREGGLRFYAAVPLKTESGHALGTIAVADYIPRDLNGIQRQTLEVFARQVMTQFELRRQRRELVEQQEKIEFTLDRAEVATWELDIERQTMQGNDLLYKWFGVAGETTLQQFRNAIHVDDYERVLKSSTACQGDGTRYEVEYRVRGSDGAERVIFARGEPHWGLSGKVESLSGVVIDITERRRAQIERERLFQQVALEKHRLERMFSESPAPIAVFEGLDLWITFANEPFYNLVGSRNLIGKRLIEALPEMVDQGLPETLRRVIKTGEAWGAESASYQFRRGPDRGPEQRHLSVKHLPVYEADGTISGVYLHAIDVTAQVAARRELERLVEERTAELREAVKEAESFNYSVSHDLRAPLRAIAATSRILLEEADGMPGPHRALLERQAYNASRLGQLIDQLLHLSRLGRVTVAHRPLDITAIAERALTELRKSGADRDCRFEIATEMRAVGDADLVRYLLYHLLENACKFSRPGSFVRLGQRGGTFFVQDEGIGFEMKYASKLFLPFERLVTEAEYPGTGIGLAQVEKIVRRHGGSIWCESTPGAGSTFSFTLAPDGD